MAGKIRYLAALIAVLGLIYIQQSSVTYAGESYSKQPIEEEKQPEEEEEKPPTEGEEKPPTEGEEKPPTEGEEKPPTEGEEKPPTEGEEKPPEEGEEKPPTEGEEKPPEEGEEKTPVEEEKKIIEGYQIEIPKPNGEQGYYTKKPEITISHMSEAGVTKYCLRHDDSRLIEKTLKNKGEKAVITGNMFLEGKNILQVWMENEEGEKIDKYKLKKEIWIDTKEPQIQMSVPDGFDAWYQGKVLLSVVGEDSESGIVKISCREGSKLLGSTNKKKWEFVISCPSALGKGIDVTVTAEDKAGNKSERVKTVFIDKVAPEVTITGAKDYMITGKTVNLSCEISEENMLQEFYAQIIWTDVKGKKKQLSSPEWKNNSKGKVLTQTLKNDGMYHVKIQAEDMSGYVSTKDMQVMIDKTNPVIRYIEALDGQQLKKFKWEYPLHQMIQDFTTYAYEMRVDGMLYHMGESIRAEGKHRMTVKATDAAGNKAQAAAEFIVDHTAPEIIFHNIEEGKEYEEEHTFSVGLAKESDCIRQIRINGESQMIDSQKKSYEYALRECKDYEVTVKAYDEAGNESEKSLFFKIVPKKSLMEKITEPIKIRWGIGEKADMQFPETVRQGKRKDSSRPGLLKVAIFIMTAGAMIVSGILYYDKVYKKKKNRHLSE